jgi:hypothetical protein
MGNILLERNELDEAERQLNKGQELIALTTFPSARILGASAIARLLNIRGNPALAFNSSRGIVFILRTHSTSLEGSHLVGAGQKKSIGYCKGLPLG